MRERLPAVHAVLPYAEKAEQVWKAPIPAMPRAQPQDIEVALQHTPKAIETGKEPT